MSNWIQDLFRVEEPITIMCHLQPLLGDPYYDADGGMEEVVAAAKADLLALQKGGINGIMFSNEFSLPYLTKVEPVVIATIARVISELEPLIIVPYGVNCLRDPIASIGLAVAIGGKFIREVISGAYASDFGLWNTNVGKTVRHRMAVGAKNLKLLFNTAPEAAGYLADRDIKGVTRSTEFNNRPDAPCVPGLTASNETDTRTLGQVKASVKHAPILHNTGRNVNNVTRQLSVANGAVCAATFKYDGIFENAVDIKRVKESVDKVKEYQVTFQGAQMAGMDFRTHPRSEILHK